MKQRLIGLSILLGLVLSFFASFIPAFSADDDVSRLYNFTSGTTIQSSQVNGELNQAVTTLNGKMSRAGVNTVSGNNTFSGNNVFSGTNTFSHASSPIATDKILEYTSTAGVTIDSVLHKDGFIRVPAGAGFLPTTNGDLGYDSTSNSYDVYVNGAAQSLYHTGQLATQSDQETSTSTTTLVTPGRQQYHPSAAKAWVRFNGTGTVAIAASYNVTSITDNGTGDYTINFTTAFSSANYGFALSAGRGVAGTQARLITGPVTAATTTGAFRVETFDIAGTLTDVEAIGGTFFGDQ